MELMIKMSAAEADEAMAKGLIQALVYPFSCREEVRKAAEKTAEKAAEKAEMAEEVKTEEPEAITSMPQRKNVAAKEPEAEQKAPKAEQKAPEDVAEKEEPKYTLDQLSKAAADLITADAGNQEKLLAILRKFSIEAMPELKAEDYSKFAEELKAIGGNL